MNYIDDIKLAAKIDLPWENLMGKNILVTGATGLIGSAITDILMAHKNANYHVYASGRNVNRMRLLFCKYSDYPNFHFIQHDVTTQPTFDIPFHFIIYTASGANPVLYSTDPIGVMKSNFIGVDNMLEYGRHHSLEKFIYVSSGDVYGNGLGDKEITEDCSNYVNPLEIRSCYASAKRATETLCVSYSHQWGIHVSIARPCHTFGPHFTESDSRAYAQFFRLAANREDIVMKSAGTQLRSWCYSVDCATGLLFILLKGKDREAYNIADPNDRYTIFEFATAIAKAANVNIVRDIPNEIEKLGYNPATNTLFDTTKLQDLGWKQQLSFEEQIEHTLIEYKTNNQL